MEQIEYKGYLIIATINKKIKAIIKNNIFEEKRIYSPRYENPITFLFSSYDSMVKFIDENPK